MLVSPPPAASALSHCPRRRREGGVRLSWTQLGGADHKSAAPKKCYKEGVSFLIGTASRFSTAGHKQTVLLAVSPSPLPPACCPPPSLVTGRTLHAIVCCPRKEAGWPRLETTLWLSRPRPQGRLGTLGVRMSFCLQRVVSRATGPMFECRFRS